MPETLHGLNNRARINHTIMRKVTTAATHALWYSYVFKRGNTQVVCTQNNGRQMYLFGHKIAEIIDGNLFINACGWLTVTTKERLNGVLDQMGFSITQQRGVWYIMGNGFKKAWNGERINVSLYMTAPEEIPEKKELFGGLALLNK